MDDVHFECRFVKPLWSIIAKANRLTVNGIDTTNTTLTQGFMELFRVVIMCTTSSMQNQKSRVMA